MYRNTVCKTALICAVILFPVTVRAAMTEIYLRDRVQISSGMIKLGDVAKIDAEANLTKQLAALSLSRFSSDENRVVLVHRDIHRMITSTGLQQFMLVGNRVVVVRPTVTISAQMMENRLKNIIRKRFAGKKFRLQVDWPSRKVLIPGKTIKKSWKSLAGIRLDGNWHRVQLILSGAENKKITVSGRVRMVPLYRRAVLVKSVKKGEQLTATSYRFINKARKDLPDNAVVTRRELRKAVAKKDLQAGTVLQRDQLRYPVTVRRGQQVEVYFRVPGIEIIAPAEALQSGRPGEVIRLRNKQSGQIISARIAFSGQLRLQGGGL